LLFLQEQIKGIIIKQRGKCRECRADDNTAGQQTDDTVQQFQESSAPPFLGEAEAAGERTAEGAHEVRAESPQAQVQGLRGRRHLPA
jgi:hypothetical protein